MSQPGPVLDYREPEWVAEKLGIDKNTVYKYLQEGSLPGVQIGRRWLVSERLLAEHLERETRKQTQMRSGIKGGVVPGKRDPLPMTPRLRRAKELATELALRHGAPAVGTEHALVAIMEEGEGIGAEVLRNLGVTPQRMRELYMQHVAQNAPRHDGGRITPSAELRQALMLAVEQAIGMGHTYFGGEHLLLGILLEPAGLGARMLQTLGITYDAARAELMKNIHGIE